MKRTTRKINSQEGRLLNFHTPLMRVGLPLIRNVITPSAKSIPMSLGWTFAVLAKNAAIQKNIFGFGMTTLIISDKELKDMIKIIKCLKNWFYW